MEFTSQYSLNEKEKDRFITALMPELATLKDAVKKCHVVHIFL